MGELHRVGQTQVDTTLDDCREILLRLFPGRYGLGLSVEGHIFSISALSSAPTRSATPVM